MNSFTRKALAVVVVLAGCAAPSAGDEGEVLDASAADAGADGAAGGAPVADRSVPNDSASDFARDAATIADARDATTIADARDATTVADVRDATTIADVRDATTIADVRDATTIADVRDATTVADVRDAATVADASDAAPEPTPSRVLLSPAGAAWRYLDDGTAPTSAWTTAGFRDDAWRMGPAQLGYGDGDEATVVRFGSDPARKPITTYFRRSFTVVDPRAFRFVIARLLRDDGAVVYLNGREARRDYLPAGPIASATLATQVVAAPEENVFHERLIDPSLLVAGVNTLAVEVHQSAPDSSDLSFDLELVGLRDALVASESDPTVLAVGDISTCRNDRDDATARIVDAHPGPVLTLGDTVYERGTTEEFARCFDPSWGRHRARIRPAVGNHEYYTPDAAPYYRYFGAAAGDPSRGYYSFDVGAWHLVALNSNCAEVGGCDAGSPQDRWLVADLAASRARCTLAYWHHPLFSSGVHGPASAVTNLYRRLHEGGADVVLSGHEHDYERFAPLDPAGRPDPARGIREFVVGTGGVELRYFPRVAAQSEARDVATHGVLRLVLRPAGYAWRFLPVEGGAFTDAGEASCH